MTENQLIEIADKKMLDVSGQDYIAMKNGTFCKATGQCFDNIFLYFAGFADADEAPELTPNKKGWTVYFTVYLSIDNGQIEAFDYQTLDGQKDKYIRPGSVIKL